MKKYSFLLDLLVVLVLLAMTCQTNMAFADNRPIITLSYGTPYLICDEGCGPSFIIKIFEDGLVKYKGIRLVEVLGSDEHRIDKSALEKLIKKFEKVHFIDTIVEVNPSWMTTNAHDRKAWRYVSGIRFRQGLQERTAYKRDQCELVNEIIKTTDAETLWELGWIRKYYCK